jgi:hypothetical protein
MLLPELAAVFFNQVKAILITYFCRARYARGALVSLVAAPPLQQAAEGRAAALEAEEARGTVLGFDIQHSV